MSSRELSLNFFDPNSIPGKKVFELRWAFTLIYVLLLFTYVILRACNLSLTFDEIATFNTLKDFSLKTAGGSANNHLLNSYLMKLTTGIFGDSPFAIRLPNILAFVLYVVAALKIGNSLNPGSRLYTLILLTAMPFLMDFFSLARGYGLGMGFMLLSLSYAIAFFKTKTFPSALISLGLGMVSVIANFTMLNFLFPLSGVLILLILLSEKFKKGALLKISVIIILSAVFIGMLFPLLWELKKGGHLFFGGHKSLFTDTICSLAACFGYMKSYSVIAKYIFVFMFLMSLAVGVYHIYSAIKRRELNVVGFLSVLFLITLLSPLLQHLILDTAFPAERTAIMYYPLMILVLFHGIHIIQNKFLNVFNIVFGLFIIIHFVFSVNLKYCYSWRYEAGTKNALLYLKENFPGNLMLGVDYIHNPSVAFYKNNINYPDLSVRLVAEAWEYPLDLEELDPYYYGVEKICNDSMPYDVKKVLFPDITIYYLDKFIVDKLASLHVQFKTIKDFPYSRSSLINVQIKDNCYFDNSLMKWVPITKIGQQQKFIIQAHNQNYVSVAPDEMLVANQTDRTKAEVFEKFDQEDGHWAIKTSAGKYICEDRSKKTGFLYANRGGIGDWEKFEILYVGDYKIRIRASSGKLVCGYSPSGDTLTANRDQGGDWETFTLNIVK